MPTLLDKDSFKELPPSALQNINDFKLFTNFKKYDLEIEAIRGVKFEYLQRMVKHEIEEASSNMEGGDR